MPALLQVVRSLWDPAVCHRTQNFRTLPAGSASVSWRAACSKVSAEGACLQLLGTHCHWCTGVAREMQVGLLDASRNDDLLDNRPHCAGCQEQALGGQHPWRAAGWTQN